MSDEDLLQNVIEIIDSANHKRLELEQRIASLEEAKSQVTESSKRAKDKLHEHFSTLKACVSLALDERLKELQAQVDEVEQDSLKPLLQCQDVIRKDIDQCASTMHDGKKIFQLCGGEDPSSTALLEYKNRVSSFDLNSLPEVPALQDVPYIQLDLPKEEVNIEKQLTEAIQDYGEVISRVPVQVTGTQPRAGALLVKWTETQAEETEASFDEYQLQYCRSTPTAGDDGTNFRDAYAGPGCQCVVKGLSSDTVYALRVRGRIDSEDTWSVWSIPMRASTHIPHFAWQRGADGYELSAEAKVAHRRGGDVQVPPAPWLFSSASSFLCGHCVVFRVLEQGPVHAEDGIALCTRADAAMDVASQTGVLFISTTGKVTVDGQEKTTQLPPLERGSSLTLDTVVMGDTKVRVTAEVCEKIVTFDWSLDPAQLPKDDPAGLDALLDFGNLGGVPRKREISLYFAARFSDIGWKISVE